MELNYTAASSESVEAVKGIKKSAKVGAVQAERS
jgi:hypothetical protein